MLERRVEGFGESVDLREHVVPSERECLNILNQCATQGLKLARLVTGFTEGVFVKFDIIPRGAKLADLFEKRFRLIGFLVDLNFDLAHLGFQREYIEPLAKTNCKSGEGFSRAL